MIDIKKWLEYYNNKKDQKLILKSYLANKEDFNKYMPYIKNYFISSLGFGLNKINEISLIILAHNFAKVVKNNKPNSKILLISDNNSNLINAFLDKMSHVFLAFNLEVIKMHNNEPISQSFLKYTMQKTQNIDFAIYISKYTYDNKYSIALYDNNGFTINPKIMQYLSRENDQIQIEDVKLFNDQCQVLNFEKLLNEYSDDIVNRNYLSKGNNLLKIGVINDNLTHSFFKKIVGKNDLQYKVINQKFPADKPYKISISKIKNPWINNINYLLKFSYDHKRVYFYSRIKSDLFSAKYKLIDINILIANYLIFINRIKNTNLKFNKITSVRSTNATNANLISQITKKYNIDYSESFKMEDNDFNLDSLLFFNEENDVILSSYQTKLSDPYLITSLILNMLNYYQTQGMNLDDITSTNIGNFNCPVIKEFSIPCAIKNIQAFETKLFVQNYISSLEIKRLDDLRHLSQEKEKCIAKIFLENEDEWIFIKYSYELKKVIFICSENKNTDGEIFKKVKKYFSKFLKKYNTNFLFEAVSDENDNESEIIENENNKKSDL
ncbi:hypothetical protein AB5V95_01445 [Metamycoplasma spumans]|uniref:hypothetical protein n=1 Tax=Metamycoplasma spumans TaxID=92406 RepID=UPI0034DCFAD4